MKVLVINPGATSTKVSIFEEEQEIFRTNIRHTSEKLLSFDHVIDQMPYRRDLILQTVRDAGYSLSAFDAVCGRGGLLRHIPSGTYAISDAAVRDVMNSIHGEHAANLGILLARELGDMAGVPSFFVDPVCVDEMTDLARISGFRGMERQSFFHALNQKTIARKAAEQLGKTYENCRLIVAHMGGGVSVAAHDHGRAVDVFNVKDEGSFGMDRGGSLPVNAVVDLCFSGAEKRDVKKVLGGAAGAYSYLGTKDFREVEQRAFERNDGEARLIFDAMAYQIAKDIGAMAAVLKFEVDAIVYTGGMAYCDRFTDEITNYVGRLAPVICLPGEEEMRALAEGALRVLHGESAKIYGSK